MPNTSSSAGGVRLAELLAVLSLGADLGMNQPMEHVLRQSLIALRLGELLGLGEAARAGLYHSSLIVWEVCDTIGQTFERWDGKGIPHGTQGEDLLLPAGSLPWPTWSRSITAPRVMTGR